MKSAALSLLCLRRAPAAATSSPLPLPPPRLLVSLLPLPLAVPLRDTVRSIIGCPADSPLPSDPAPVGGLCPPWWSSSEFEFDDSWPMLLSMYLRADEVDDSPPRTPNTCMHSNQGQTGVRNRWHYHTIAASVVSPSPTASRPCPSLQPQQY